MAQEAEIFCARLASGPKARSEAAHLQLRMRKVALADEVLLEEVEAAPLHGQHRAALAAGACAFGHTAREGRFPAPESLS